MRGVDKPVDTVRSCIGLAIDVVELFVAIVGLEILLILKDRLPFALDIVIGGVK